MKYLTWFKPEQHNFEFARRAVEAGLAGFEAVYRESYVTPEVQGEYLSNLRRIKKDLAVDFTVHAPANDVNLGSLNEAARVMAYDEIKKSLDFAGEIGASLVVVHPGPGIEGMPGGKWSKEYSRSRVEDRFFRQEEYLLRAVKNLADYAPDLLICLENLVYPHESYRSPEEMLDLIRKVNRSNVGITLDVGHAVVCGHKPVDFLHLLEEEIFHVHLHDNDGIVDRHLPLGKGIIDYVAVLQSLNQVAYQGAVTLEFELEDPRRYGDYIHQFG